MARLLAARALLLSASGSFFAEALERPATPAERAVLALRSPIRWREIVQVLDHHVEPVERRMIAAGLLTTREERRRNHVLAMLPFALLFAFGRQIDVGMMATSGRYMILLMLGICARFIRWASDPRTREGGRLGEAASGPRLRPRRPPRHDLAVPCSPDGSGRIGLGLFPLSARTPGYGGGCGCNGAAGGAAAREEVRRLRR